MKTWLHLGSHGQQYFPSLSQSSSSFSTSFLWKSKIATRSSWLINHPSNSSTKDDFLFLVILIGSNWPSVSQQPIPERTRKTKYTH